MNIRIFAFALFFAVPFVTAQPAGVPPGPPAVEITGTVDTNVVNVPDVIVANTPLPVVVQAAARTPVQVHETNNSCTFSCQIIMLTVPVGQRLVVEYLAAATQIDTPGVSGTITVSTKFLDQSQSIRVGITENSGPGGNTKDVFGEVVKLYADPDAEVRCSLTLSSVLADADFFTCTLSGFLEDIP